MVAFTTSNWFTLWKLSGNVIGKKDKMGCTFVLHDMNSVTPLKFARGHLQVIILTRISKGMLQIL